MLLLGVALVTDEPAEDAEVVGQQAHTGRAARRIGSARAAPTAGDEVAPAVLPGRSPCPREQTVLIATLFCQRTILRADEGIDGRTVGSVGVLEGVLVRRVRALDLATEVAVSSGSGALSGSRARGRRRGRRPGADDA